jgi:hypothetical protein
VESRERKLLRAPPREAVPVPGAPAAFGRGFWQRYRSSRSGCLTLFLAVGAGLFLFGLANIAGPYASAEREDPVRFLGAMAFGVVFILVALRMLQVQLIGAEHRRRRGRGANHWKPWTSDHPWRPEGMDPDYSATGSGHVLGTVAILSVIALFNLALASSSYVFRAVVLLFDLFGLLILLDALLKLWQSLRRARPRLRWTTFPAFLGERLEGVFTTQRPLSATGPVRAALRCVRDEWTEHKDVDEDTGRETKDRHLLPYVLYARSLEVPVEGRIKELPFAFDLPADLPGTDLMRKEPVYWQVMVEVPLNGPDFDAIFLAPVYERRGRS